jgi:hypothetical protein
MYPLIRDGDMVLVTPVVMEQVNVGDVICFRVGKQVRAHRVVRYISEGQCSLPVTRGDNLLPEDGPIREAADLFGVVRIVHRGNRRIRLDRGLPGYLGRLIAQSRTAHLFAYGAIRLWWHTRRWVGGLLPSDRTHRAKTKVE